MGTKTGYQGKSEDTAENMWCSYYNSKHHTCSDSDRKKQKEVRKEAACTGSTPRGTMRADGVHLLRPHHERKTRDSPKAVRRRETMHLVFSNLGTSGYQAGCGQAGSSARNGGEREVQQFPEKSARYVRRI